MVITLPNDLKRKVTKKNSRAQGKWQQIEQVSALVFSGYYCEHRKQGEAGNNFLLQIKGLLQNMLLILHSYQEINIFMNQVQYTYL